MHPLLYKKFFLFVIPLSYVFGEYNAGFQYRFSQNWAADASVAYVDDIQNSVVSNIYVDVFNSNRFYYHGLAFRAGIISLYPRGINPFKTDYNKLELSYKMLRYDNLDFVDNADSGKVFNISEKMNGCGLSWIIGYDIFERDMIKLDGFLGFGLQFRFRDILVNSYGYDFQSDMFPLDDEEHSFGVVPLLNVGVRIGLKTGNKYDSVSQ